MRLNFLRTCAIFVSLCIFPSLILADPKNPQNEEKTIIVVSDTQSPLWVEEIFLSSNNNEIARSILFNRIAKSRPEAVFHLGDLVSLGYSEESWIPFDQFLSILHSLQIPFYPTLGNHELMIFSDDGEENFISRFPFYSKTGYYKKIGSLAFILLNSNFSDLTDEQIEEQQNWYKDRLNSLENDPSVKAVIVGCHHPPFTNSRIVSSDEDVQQLFVPEFMRYTKTRLFLSGHAHSFEHFSKSGKDFLTIGGGGGLRHPLYEGDEVHYNDLYSGDMNKRSFHYLQCRFNEHEMMIQVKMLNSDFADVATVYEIPFLFKNPYIVEKK